MINYKIFRTNERHTIVEWHIEKSLTTRSLNSSCLSSWGAASRRNDFISHVREAATVALEQIGGAEAEKAIHITKVLSDEIRTLVQEQHKEESK